MNSTRTLWLPALLGAALLAPAGERKSAEKKIGVTPVAALPSPEENEAGALPRREVSDALANSPNEETAWIAGRIRAGQANAIHHRAYWYLHRSLGSTTGAAPADWAVRAQAARERLPVARPPTPARDASFFGPTPDQVQATYTWSSLGPTNYSSGGDLNQGRATAVWINPANAANWLLGFADGGLWKTTDSGTTWTSLFDRQALLSVGAIAVDPTNANTIYVGAAEGNFSGSDIAGVNAGVFKSADGGTTWTRYTIPWPTVNNGTSFNGPLTPFVRGIRRLVIDPKNTSRLYAAASGGVMMSTDAGVTWTMLNSGGIPYTGSASNCNAGAVMYATDVVIDGSTLPNSTVYAAMGRPFSSGACTPGNLGRRENGVFRSTDNGTTWTKIAAMGTAPFPALADCAGFGRIALAIAPSAPATLYMLVHRPGAESTCAATADSYTGTYRTTNATAATPTWTQQSTTNFCSGQCWYDMTGVVDPTNANTVYFAGLDLYQSTNGGATLTQKSNWTGTGTGYIHADHHHMAMPNGTTLIDATDGGLFVSTISGTTVSSANKNGGGLSTLQFYSIGQHPTTANRIHGGLQDNGEAYNDGTGTWVESAGGDGGFSATDQVNGNNAYEEYVYAIISRSTNGGASYGGCIRNFGGCTLVNACSGNCVPDSATEFIAPFVLDPNAQGVMYTASKFLYRNTNLASNAWTKLCSNGTGTCTGALVGTAAGEDVSAIHVSAAGGATCNGNTTSCTIYSGSSSGVIYKSTNGATGATPFTKIDLSTGASPNWTPRRGVTSFVTDPANGANVIAGYDDFNSNAASALPSPTAPGHVWRSTNGGTSWTDISGALPDTPVLSMALDPADVNSLYVGTYAGVYLYQGVWGASPTLTNVTANLPNVAVMALQFTNATAPKRLRAATHGRGIWELTVSASTATPVSEGTPTPLRASKGAGSNVTVTFDIATCTTNAGFNAYWGNLTSAALSAYTYSGQECAVTSGGNITTIPAAGSAFFVVVGTDGATQESRNTKDSAGVFHGSGVGRCGITTQNGSSTCP